MRVRRVRGFSLAVVLVVLALVMIGIVAGFALTRLGRSNTDASTTVTRLATAQAALEQFASAARRLPCPANPAADTGDEVTSGLSKCSFDQGTIPWKTIGLRRDDAYDAWGFKLSYRVYTGNAGGFGSLVQADGVNMTQCDLVDPAPAGVDATTGLCRTNTDVYLRATLDTQFLAGKGLDLTDMAPPSIKVAYVIISHGASGYGAYTVSGAQMPLPSGVERNNTNANGPFTIQAFSDPDTGAAKAAHFDDLLVYRTLPELIRKIGLYARDWPEGGKVQTIATALGAVQGNTGTSTATYAGVTYQSFTSGGTASNFSYVIENGVGSVGGVAGGNNYLGMTEYIRMDLGTADYKRFGIGLSNFGYLAAVTPRNREQVEFRFYAGGSPVGTPVTRQGCALDGSLATMVVDPTDPDAKFDRVEIQPKAFLLTSTASSLVLISEFTACGAGITCVPQLATTSNTCTVPALASTAYAPSSVTLGTPSTWTLTVTPGTDQAGLAGISFDYALPTGLAFTSTPSGTCAGTVSLKSLNAGFSTRDLSYPSDAASCTLTATVAASAAGSFADSTASITKTANIRNTLTGGTLTVTPP